MNKTLFNGLLFAATLGLLSGCQDPTPEQGKEPPTPIVDTAYAEDSTATGSANSEWMMCPEQRPEMCAQIYQPVCGIMDTGVRCVTTPCPSSTQKTFGNACTACAEIRVSQYRDGECESTNEDVTKDETVEEN